MICKNCGRELPPDAGFCEDCGTPAASPKKERKPLDERHQYLITVVLGGLASSIVTMLLNAAGARFGIDAMIGSNSLSLYLNVFTNTVFYTCLLLTVIGYSGGEKRRKIFSVVISVFTLTVSAVMLLGSFTFAGRLVHGMLYREYSETANGVFRIFGITALVFTAFAAAAGFIVKKKLLITGIVLGALLFVEVCFILAVLFIAQLKATPDFAPVLVGTAYGVLIPVVYVFPNVGLWKAGK
ncbi:MAG: zinc ribbon domain-containing protein [Clostridiales bacterium]|nr:zinc ribbon domain-containing protein [Clostridiales bacterium]